MDVEDVRLKAWMKDGADTPAEKRNITCTFKLSKITVLLPVGWVLAA